MRGPVWRRIVAWSEMAVLFALLYIGVPWAGLQVDRWLGIPAWPWPLPWLGLGLFAIGVAGLGWCFALFVRVGRGTPNPTAPPAVLVTVRPYAWTRNPIAMSHAAALIGLSVLVGSVSAVAIVVALAERVPLVDQDALRRRQLPGELLDETPLVRVEPLELRLDPLLSGEEAADRGHEEAHALPERHLPPHASEHGTGVLVDERDLAADLLRRLRGRDHLVPDLDAVLPCDPDLELSEQRERRQAPGSGLAAHERLVASRIELERDHARAAREDLRADRPADVEDVADTEERDHRDVTIPASTITLCLARARRVRM